MEEKDLISKKDLLQLTGISYGQLYRWKRENLIPESWFIKKSSFTGQETFFPKDKILKRTSMILELKDKYSLEELGSMFSPETTNRTFRPADFEEITEIKKDVVETFIQVFQRDKFNFIELTFIYLVSKLNKESILEADNIRDIAESIQNWLPHLKSTSYNLIVFQNESGVFTLLIQQDAEVYPDNKFKELKRVFLDEEAKELHAELSEILEGGV